MSHRSARRAEPRKRGVRSHQEEEGREHGAETEGEEQRVRPPVLEEFGRRRKDLASPLFSCFFFCST